MYDATEKTEMFFLSSPAEEGGELCDSELLPSVSEFLLNRSECPYREETLFNMETSTMVTDHLMTMIKTLCLLVLLSSFITSLVSSMNRSAAVQER